jgi:hypothetical protein
MQRKPILCIDFDGVIHDCREGWKDGSIYGDVTPGFFRWATEAKQLFKLVVYSSRSKDALQLEEMKRWLEARIAESMFSGVMIDDFEFSGVKPPAFLTIDDRCVRFNGNWGAAQFRPENLADYKTWTQL